MPFMIWAIPLWDDEMVTEIGKGAMAGEPRESIRLIASAGWVPPSAGSVPTCELGSVDGTAVIWTLEGIGPYVERVDWKVSKF